jgi:hypothetical protein
VIVVAALAGLAACAVAITLLLVFDPSMRGRGEWAEHPDVPEEQAPRGRLYMTRAATNQVLIPHERDCQDLPSYERLAALYSIPEETR